MRAGIGYDVHRFKEGGPLILGGISIPFDKSLLAHSDGDCLIHAIIDSILGASGLYDIGTYFPDNDEKFKNISSLELLKKANLLINSKNYGIVNIDTIIICEEPKIKPHIDKMRETLSLTLNIDKSQISIKATTEEGLGFTGRKEGIACKAICMIKAIG